MVALEGRQIDAYILKSRARGGGGHLGPWPYPKA